MDGKFSQRIFRLSTIAVFTLALTISNVPGTFAELKPTNLLSNLAKATAQNILPVPLPSAIPSAPVASNTSTQSTTFKNPILPWINPHGVSVYHHTDDRYYLASIYPPAHEAVERGQSIFIMSSPNLHDWTGAFEQRKTVYNVSTDLTDIWIFGTRLQHLNGGWYIYFTMEVNETLETSKHFVIGAKSGINPMEAEFGEAIRLKTPDSPDDITDFSGQVLEYGQKSKELFFVWRRIPYHTVYNTSGSNDVGLYIAPMSSPTEISGPAVLIRKAEGRAVAGGGLLLVNSHSLPKYEEDPVFLWFMPRPDCIQLLKLDHGFHPLVEDNWQEVPNERCALTPNEKQSVFHIKPTNLVPSLDLSETWLVYSASDSQTEYTLRRSIRAERIAWNRVSGEPIFPRAGGVTVSHRAPKDLRRPSTLPYPVSTHPGQPQAPALPAAGGARRAPGSLGDASEPSEHVIDLVRRLTPEIHAEVCRKSSTDDSCQAGTDANSAAPLTAVQYKTQTVSGTNYFVKVRRGAEPAQKVWHVRIYEQTWTDTLQLSRVEGPKEEADELGYF